MSEFVIKRSVPQPVYEQLLEEFRGNALKSAPGTPLPSENSICRKYGVARMTVSRAMNQLVREGVIYRERGRGTFVKKIENNPVYYIFPYSEALREQNYGSFLDMYYGVRDYASEHRLNVDTLVASPNNLRMNIDWEVFNKLPVNSVIILNSIWYKLLFPVLTQKKCRVIYIDRQQETDFCFQQEFDNWRLIEADRRGGVFQVVKHLKAGGYRNIALCHSFSHYRHPCREAWRDALIAENLEYRQELDVYVRGTIDSAYNYMLNMVDMRSRYSFDAVITGTATQAFGVFQALRDLKINVPGEIALAALENSKMLESNILPISAMEIPEFEIGRLAAKKAFEPNYQPDREMVACSFIERLSSQRKMMCIN